MPTTHRRGEEDELSDDPIAALAEVDETEEEDNEWVDGNKVKDPDGDF